MRKTCRAIDRRSPRTPRLGDPAGVEYAPVGRATPCLLGLFSLMVLLAHTPYPEDLPSRRAAWYPKTEPTFIDALAAVRRHLWASRNQPPLASTPTPANSSVPLLDALVEAAAYAAWVEPERQPDGMADDLGREAMAMVQGGSTGTTRSYPAPRLANLSTPNIARRGLSGDCQVGSKANVRSEPGRSSGRHVQPGAPGQYWANSVDPDACSRRSGGRSAPRSTAFR